LALAGEISCILTDFTLVCVVFGMGTSEVEPSDHGLPFLDFKKEDLFAKHWTSSHIVVLSYGYLSLINFWEFTFVQSLVS